MSDFDVVQDRLVASELVEVLRRDIDDFCRHIPNKKKKIGVLAVTVLFVKTMLESGEDGAESLANVCRLYGSKAGDKNAVE